VASAGRAASRSIYRSSSKRAEGEDRTSTNVIGITEDASLGWTKRPDIKVSLPPTPKRRRNDMSKEALAKVVQRAISDAAFRRQLNSDPAGALRGFDLSADEASALRTGDAGRLSTLGVDQRMSKSFALGGGLASTRLSASDLTPGGGPSAVDDLSGSGSRTALPGDPMRSGGSADASGSEATQSTDVDAGTSGTSTVRAGDDWKFAGRVAPEGTGTVRTGDDWKFTGGQQAASQAHVGDDWKFAARADAQSGSVAPVEGSPEATALENKIAGSSASASIRAGDDWARTGNASVDQAAQSRLGKLDETFSGGNKSADGMANYPAHDGLAGPSAAGSVRAGDDWARTGNASVDQAAQSRLGKLDETFSGGNKSADGMANYPAHDGLAGPSAAGSVRAGDDWARSSAGIGDSARIGNARLDDASAASQGSRLEKLDSMFTGGNADASAAGSEGASRLAKLDETLTGGSAAADASGSTPTSAFIDDSESYLTKVGYDSSASSTPDTTYSGDDIAGPHTVADPGSDTPHPSTDDGQLTP
jgi:hypothetical protein